LEALLRLERRILVAEKVLVTVALGVMVLVNVGLIASRLIPAVRLGLYLDVVVGLMPWVALLGASIAVAHSRHVGFLAVFNAVGPRLRTTFVVVGTIAMFAFFSVLIYGGLEVVTTQQGMGQRTPALGLPRWWVSLAVPVSGALMTFHLLLRFPEKLRAARAGQDEETSVD
jgi:TRAP-type transport system small permease protein